jgi:hypothetical protein
MTSLAERIAVRFQVNRIDIPSVGGLQFVWT